MSAFIVSNRHLDYMLTAALRFGKENVGRLTWLVHEEDNPDNYQRGSVWGPGSIASANRRRRELTRETATRVGAVLAAENRRSVDHRYDENEIEDFYEYRPFPADISPVQVLKAIHCYEYQSCEHPGWKTSEAHEFCRALEVRAMTYLPGYEEAKWGID